MRGQAGAGLAYLLLALKDGNWFVLLHWAGATAFIIIAAYLIVHVPEWREERMWKRAIEESKRKRQRAD